MSTNILESSQINFRILTCKTNFHPFCPYGRNYLFLTLPVEFTYS